MKKVFLIHGWGESPDEPLYKWLSSNLEREGLEVITPVMPNTEKPIIETWIAKLHEVVGDEINNNVILLGHSIGCQAILRYLAGLGTPGLLSGLVFVAPWLKVSGLETEDENNIAKPWLETTLNNQKILEHIPQNKFTAIFSDNDPFVPKENWEQFEHVFGAKVIIESGKGHFTADDGIVSLPSALEAVLKMK